MKKQTISNGFKIEKGIPAPDKSLSGTTSLLRAMKIGDSFLTDYRGRNNAGSRAIQLGLKVSTRIQPDGQYRVWRIA